MFFYFISSVFLLAFLDIINMGSVPILFGIKYAKQK